MYISNCRWLYTFCLCLWTAGWACAQNPAVTINVDANASVHPISPYIYGMAYPDPTSLSDLNVPLNRYGGNNTSRYNWTINADNRANDYFFESIGDNSSVPGERVDTFISSNKSAGAQSLVTIPLLNWIAKLGPNRAYLWSFSTAKYGAQKKTDMYRPDAGNGIWTNGQYVTGNDPNDANTPSDSTLQNGWLQHLVQTWGTAANGGLKYYVMDNEPSIWHSTHRDVHPTGATMAEIRDKIIDYAGKVKANDPSALVVGPEEWGWSGYFYSGYDQQYGNAHGWSNLPDRAANGNRDYLPWLLDQLRQNNTITGRRLLDVFSVHYYPQGGEFGDDVSTATQLLRNRSTRSLWDPNYVDQSWINDKVQLIPRLKNWVNAYYPGTQTAITEYNWGAEGSMNGATAQADIFGIFGREGLDMAARWTTPPNASPTYLAVKMYRNYDGNKSTFGDTSVSTTVPNPDNLSAFGAVRSSDGALTLMVINKDLSSTTPVTVNLANFNSSGTAQTWQLASGAITHLADTPVSSSLSFSAPAQSITLFILPARASSWKVVDLASGADNKARFLWKKTDGAASLWSVDNAGGFTSSSSYGPYSGWTPTAVAAGADGMTRILWNKADGTAALFLMTSGNAYQASYAFGPYMGWTAVDVSVGSDNKARILWTNTNGAMALWTVDNSGSFTSSSAYGPYPGFTATRLAAGGDGLTRVLWNKSDGTAVLWLLNSDNTYQASSGYGPYSGWIASDLAIGSDNKTRILWTNTTGAMALWSVDNSGSFTSSNSFGPYAGYSARSIASSPATDNVTRMLWTRTDGTAVYWLVNSNNTYQASYSYGPY